ncbi:MAG: acyltransferase family protein [Solirubrobacteraceae bacterium]
MSTLSPSRLQAPALGAGSGADAGRRVANLDVLRALAALAVLVGHAYVLGGRVLPVKAQHGYDVPLITLASAVWLFFAISGYVISRPWLERLLSGQPLPILSGYARRRAARIFPLYWVALAAFIALAGSSGAVAWQFPFHILLINNLVPGRQGALFSVAWTLTLEVLFYACVPLLAALIRARRSQPTAVWLARAVLISWGLSIGFALFADLLGDGRIGLWLRGSLPAMWQMFCPGLLLVLVPYLPGARIRNWLIAPEPRRPAWLGAVGGLLVAGALLGAAAPLGSGIVAYQVMVDASRPLFAAAYGLIIAATIAARPWRARGLVALGAASYGIYLLHPVIETALAHAGLVPWPHDTLSAFVVHAVALAALTIPAALASWRWFERPILACATRGRPRARPPAPTAAGDMREFWNARAREDAFYFVDTRQPYRATEAERFWDAAPLVDYLLEGLGVELSRADLVLEIGCGLGRMTRVLAGRSREVLALDVSDQMLERAREHNPHLGNVRWILGDGTTLAPIADASVDACFSTVVFQHVPDPEIILGYVREVGRVLRPGGWAALQVSTDPAIHRPRGGVTRRLAALAGRRPQGQRHPAWLGAPVEVSAVRAAARDGAMTVERVWGEGGQYTQLLLRRAAWWDSRDGGQSRP